MKFSEYSELLKTNLLAIWIPILILAAIVIIPEIRYIRNPKKKKDSKFESEGIFGFIVLAFIILVFSVESIESVLDIAKEDYVCVHGEYYMYNPQYKYYNSRYIEATTDDGELIQFVMLREGMFSLDDERYPVGKCEGTIWYAEHSKYMLEFIPDPGCEMVR